MVTGFRLIGVFLYFFCITISSAANLSINEQKIMAFIDTQEQSQLSLLEQLVNINSGSSNIPGVMKVGAILQKQFEDMGFKVRWARLPKYMQRASTLIAERKGTRGKRLLLIGHLDTVFAKNSPFQRFERKGAIATGPGVVDDKGGDVVIVYALKALNSIDALKDATITVVLTGDEEDSGKPTSISRKPLLDVAREVDVALDFESDVSQDTASIARRGISLWEIRTQAKGAHSSAIFRPSVGDGAIFELARILNTMRTELSGQKHLTFNPGLILGGTQVSYKKKAARGLAFGKENVIAQTAIASGDLRFLTAEQVQQASDRMVAIVNKHLPETSARIEFLAGIPAMPPTPANEALLKQYSTVSEDLGYGKVRALDPDLRGAGDISHVASIVPANLVGLGPIGHGEHSEMESVEIASLSMQTKRAALLIYRLIDPDLDRRPSS